MIGFGIRLECFGLENVACKCFWFGPSRTWLETPPSEKKMNYWRILVTFLDMETGTCMIATTRQSTGFCIWFRWCDFFNWRPLTSWEKKLVMPHNRDIAPARPSSADPQRVVALAAIHRLCGTHSWPHQKWWCLHAAHLSVHSNESRWGISQRGFQP